jgi:hypothetical protein
VKAKPRARWLFRGASILMAATADAREMHGLPDMEPIAPSGLRDASAKSPQSRVMHGRATDLASLRQDQINQW